MKSVSVFVPAYNEEGIIGANILKLYKKMLFLKRDFDVYLVDDGSTDNTQKIGKAMSKKPRFHYIRFDKGPSRRENLALAFRKSKKDIIMFIDADLSTSLDYLKKVLNKIDGGYDISIGSRYSGIKPKRKLSRRIISAVYNLFLRLYFGSKVRDHQCGFKAFDRKCLLKLLDEMGYDKSFHRGWFWDAELLIRAQNNSYSIAEVPVEWKSGARSTFRFGVELKMLKAIHALKKIQAKSDKFELKN